MGRLKSASRRRIIESEEPENEDRKPQDSLENEEPLEIPVISSQKAKRFFYFFLFLFIFFYRLDRTLAKVLFHY